MATRRPGKDAGGGRRTRRTPQDNAYKVLFSHPEMVRDLLRSHVAEPWVATLEFDTLEKASGQHVSDDLRDRDNDLIWRAERDVAELHRRPDRRRPEHAACRLIGRPGRPDPAIALRRRR